jgi:hypothetical protein
MVGGLQRGQLIRGQFLANFSRGLRGVGSTFRTSSHAFAHPFAHILGVTQSRAWGKRAEHQRTRLNTVCVPLPDVTLVRKNQRIHTSETFFALTTVLASEIGWFRAIYRFPQLLCAGESRYGQPIFDGSAASNALLVGRAIVATGFMRDADWTRNSRRLFRDAGKT